MNGKDLEGAVPGWLRVNSGAADVYARFPLKELPGLSPNAATYGALTLRRLYRSRVLPIRMRNAVWQLARRSNLDQSWFAPFQQYWAGVLGGRPLWNVQDFHFARNFYRGFFSDTHIDDNADAGRLLASWQKPAMLFQLMHFVAREGDVNRLNMWTQVTKHLGGMPYAFLEYGCGSAPVTTTFMEFHGRRGRSEAYIADIQTLAFHYAVWKLGWQSHVHPLLLAAENDFRLELQTTMDAIFCVEVFEHLNQPLETVKRFHTALRSGGLLVFDYFAGELGAWETRAGQAERIAVLRFIEKAFDVVAGRIVFDGTTALTFARRR